MTRDDSCSTLGGWVGASNMASMCRLPSIIHLYGHAQYRISSNRSPRLLILLEPPGSPMNMTLFKTPRFFIIIIIIIEVLVAGSSFPL